MSFVAIANIDASVQNPWLEGDYLEFGVYRGNSFIIANRAAKKYNLTSMRYFAFDSFEGMPEQIGLDAQYQRELGIDESGVGFLSCSVEEFTKILRKNKIDLGNVSCIPGWFDDTLNEGAKNKVKIQKAAVIMIDCDRYESTVPVLSFCTDLVQDGTIFIFSDWFNFKGNPNWGEQKAFREWLDRNSDISVTQYHKFGPWGNSFIIHLNK